MLVGGVVVFHLGPLVQHGIVFQTQADTRPVQGIETVEEIQTFNQIGGIAAPVQFLAGHPLDIALNQIADLDPDFIGPGVVFLDQEILSVEFKNGSGLLLTSVSPPQKALDFFQVTDDGHLELVAFIGIFDRFRKTDCSQAVADLVDGGMEEGQGLLALLIRENLFQDQVFVNGVLPVDPQIKEKFLGLAGPPADCLAGLIGQAGMIQADQAQPLVPLLLAGFFSQGPKLGDRALESFFLNRFQKVVDGIDLKSVDGILRIGGTVALVLWIFGKELGVDATITAISIVSIMILSGIISWDDLLSDKAAFNVFIWFATLVALADGLKKVGILDFIGKNSQAMLSDLSLTSLIIALILLFYVLHYFFASTTAHVTALVPLFMVIASTFIPAEQLLTFTILLAGSLGVMGIITPYGCGPSPIWYGAGYISQGKWWALGAIFGAIYLIPIIIGVFIFM